MTTTEQSRMLTCVYCGHEYPQGTPAAGNQVLTAHIAKCELHPMRAVIEQRDRLRAVLAALVGASTAAELDQMEVGLRLAPAPAEDKAVALDAVHILRLTLPRSDVSAETGNQLWCIHIEGPDDIAAMPSQADADTVAASINKDFADSETKYGVRIHARAAHYNAGAEAHQRNLDESFHEYAHLVAEVPKA